MNAHWIIGTAVLLAAGCSNAAEPRAIISVDLGFDAEANTDVQAQDVAIEAHDATDATDADASGPPEVPVDLTHWVTGDAEDANVTLAGPGLILMGGGAEPDEAFAWWRELVAGGDVVVLRVSGADGYNDYLFSDIGGVDSVETLKVTSRELADSPYVAHQVDRAEAVFIAGGDQWNYIALWKNTALQDALNRVLDRGAVLGGTSAGLAVLGDRAFSAENGTVFTEDALADPFHEDLRFEDDFLEVPELRGIISDSHFRERDRMGRLAAFVARMWVDGWVDPVGVGVDESTALLIGPSGRQVVGRGAVYEVRSEGPPERCAPGERLDYRGLLITRTTSGATTEHTVSVVDGVIDQLPYAP